MSDNTVLNAGTGGDTIATDELTSLNGGAVSGIKAQRVKVGFGSDGALRDVDAANPLPVADIDVTTIGTLAAVAQTVVLALNADSSAAIQLTGTWAGTIQFEGSADGGTTYSAISAVAASTSTPQPTTTLNGLYRLTPAGLSHVRAYMTAFTSGSAGVSIRASAATGGIFANQILPTKVTDGTNTVGIKAALTAPATTDAALVVALSPNSVNTSGSGFLKVTDEPGQMFYDPFDAAPDTTNMWTSTQGSGGAAAAVAAGLLTMGTGTAANGYSKIASIPTFKPVIPGWVVYSDAIGLPDGAAPIANAYRFWGCGTTPATPTAAAPITDGYGFELGTDGKLRAVVYAAGVQTVIQDLSTSGNGKQPLNATMHRWIIQVRTDKTFFYIDSIGDAGLAASTSFQSPQIQTLPKLFLCIGGATAPASNVQIQCSGAGVSDSSKSSKYIADATYPWRRATVKPASAAAVAGDTALVMAIHPSSNLVANAGTFAVQSAATLAAETTKVIGTVNLPALTKGTQGANGVSTQDLKDAGRSAVHFYALIPVLATATDVLQSLTGTRAGATVTAVTTPAVVTAGKTLRITRLAATYIATATSGYAIVRLRFNPAAVVAVTSPVAATLAIGSSAPVTANSAGTEEATLSDGWEFTAGTGIGISVQGFAAATPAAVGYVLVSVTGFEY